MQGTGKSYEISGETTEWEDILIKKGIKTREEVFMDKGFDMRDVRISGVFKNNINATYGCIESHSLLMYVKIIFNI